MNGFIPLPTMPRKVKFIRVKQTYCLYNDNVTVNFVETQLFFVKKLPYCYSVLRKVNHN